jgi:hypothetical protein
VAAVKPLELVRQVQVVLLMDLGLEEVVSDAVAPAVELCLVPIRAVMSQVLGEREVLGGVYAGDALDYWSRFHHHA